MPSRARAFVRASAPLAFGLSLAGCSLAYCADGAFERDLELRSGEIAGTAFVESVEKKPAAFVQASVRGTSFVRRTSSEGRFVFSGLQEGPWMVTVSEDEDGDGKPERRRIVSAVLRDVPHRTSPSYVPLVTEEGQAQLAGVDVGEVLLEGTVRVSGTVLLDTLSGGVPPSDLGRVAVVVAGRNLALPRLDSDGTDLVALGAEAKTGVDATGAFQLRNVSGGDLYLLVLVYEQGASPGVPGALVQVSEPVLVSASGDENVTLADGILLPTATQPERRPVQPVFSPPPASDEEVYLVFVPPGREMPPCEDAPLDYTGTPFPYALTTQMRPAGGAPQLPDAPVGVWDVQACFSRSPPGTLFEQPILPEVAGEDPVLLGPVLLTDLQACLPSRPCEVDADCADAFSCDETAGRCVAPDGWTDCDGDDVRGLPRIQNEDDRSKWAACGSVCFAAPGTAVGDLSCELDDGTVFDCDDDGDGQADVTESQACYGVGKGTDSDGDGVCDGIDPFPACRANTAAACEAGADPDGPVLSSEYAAPAGEVDICPMEVQYPPAPFDQAPPYCAVQAFEQCSVGSMVCELAPEEGQPANHNVCDAAGRGCLGGHECALDLLDAEGAIAPCYDEVQEGCVVGEPGGCPLGETCATVADARDLCVTDLSQLTAPVQGTLDCFCCNGDSCPEPEQAPSFSMPYTATGLVALCDEGEEANLLWNGCFGAGGGTDSPAPLPDAGVSDRTDAGAELNPDAGAGSGGGQEGCDVTAPSTKVVFTAEDLTGLDGITCLVANGGALDINGSAATVINLALVEVFEGSLFIQDNSALTDIVAESLREIRGPVTLNNNPVLGALSLPVLERIDGDLKVWRNPSLIVSAAIVTVSTLSTQVSANGCSVDNDCLPFMAGITPSCQLVTALGATVCVECTETLTCPDFGQCDTTYESVGTGTYTCDGGGAVDGGVTP